MDGSADKQENHLAPADSFVLHSADLRMILDRLTGLPYMYYFNGTGIRGENPDSCITAIICRSVSRSFLTLPLHPVSVKTISGHADLLFKAEDHGRTAVSFHLKYDLTGSSLIVSQQQIKERSGYELIETSLPDLVSVREADGPGWVADAGRGGGGTLVDLRNAAAYQSPESGFFGKIGYVLPVAIVGTDKLACAMEVSAFMDGMKVEITGENGHRQAGMGTVQTYRVHGGRYYNMNDGMSWISGNSHTPNLVVGQISRCRLDFVGDFDHNGSVNWLDGAKLIAERMPVIPTKYFNDKFVYLIAGKNKTEPEPRTTFAQSEKLIHDIAELTDFAPQVAFVSGWVYDGQDTGYPSEDKVNESLGGYRGLLHLMKTGRNYNANVSVNTNFDDAYRSSPLFDSSFIARRPDGKIWKSRSWDADTSYIVGMAKYMQRLGPQRIGYAVKRYGLHDAILVDALSWFAIRNDWDPAHPASGYKNLISGRYRIITEFLKYGIHLSSEQLRYPYIGKMALSADGAGGGDAFASNKEMIPLIATIYRKSAIWGSGDFPKNDVPDNLFWNCRPMPWFNDSTDRESITDLFYLTVLPYNRIHNHRVESYKRIGDSSVIGLSGNIQMAVNWRNHDYAVVVNGIKIAGNEATVCSLDSNRIAFYSRNSGQLTAELPAGWNPDALVARVLTVDRRKPVRVEIRQNKITVSVLPHQPVIVYRSEREADRHRP
ncbi:MAG: endo-alpha-N-acetylgalactosaminidase family protein [Bacteroidota bacterium]|nr:endo-alpha-N-acetylgalactosaminidase family protein [Bacteroidota bacterium]